MCTELMGKSVSKKLKTIPLFNDTICRRILDMSDDIKKQMTERLSVSGYFALQLDEPTDLANHAILLVYLRRVGLIQSAFRLFCQEMGIEHVQLLETGFSALSQLKNESRNKLDIEHNLRIALSSITPDV
ncbi:SCND3 protein, partial [Polyodon spathula]|nr:SCND3 protein [Polyodon spathula]